MEKENKYGSLTMKSDFKLHESVASLIREYIPKTANVLDLAAGEGAFSKRLVDLGYSKVDAVELRKSVIKFKGVSTKYSIDLNTPFHFKLKKKYDLVVAMEIIEHLENPRAFIRECKMLLKKKGFLLITTPNIDSSLSRLHFLLTGTFRHFDDLNYTQSGHIMPLGFWQINKIFKENDLSIVKSTKNRNQPLFRLAKKPRYIFMWILNVLLKPFMCGNKNGEINIFLLKQSY